MRPRLLPVLLLSYVCGIYTTGCSSATNNASPAVEAMLVAFDQPTEFDCIEVPLSAFLKLLHDKHGIQFKLDDQLRSKDAAFEFLVTRNVKGISLRSALLMVMADQGLSIAIDGDAVLITTAASAQARWQELSPALVERAMKGQSALAASNEAKIKAALAEPTDIGDMIVKAKDWNKKNGGGDAAILSDVIDFLRIKHQIPIQFDVRGMQRVGTASDAPVTYAGPARPVLADALKGILSPLKLGHETRYEVIWITGTGGPEAK